MSSSSGAPSLDGEKHFINLSPLREQAVRDVLYGLETVEGRKVMVLDPKFSGPLGLVVEVPLLKSNGVENIYHLTSTKGIDTDCANMIFLCRPRPELMRDIAFQIRYNIKNKRKKSYHLMLVPRSTMIAQRILEEEGVYGELEITEYGLDLIPFENDVLSLEMEDSYRQCTLEGDETSLFYVGRGIMKLQNIFGLIPQISGKGPFASHVKDLLLRLRNESEGELPHIEPEIKQLILIDRHLDPLTPMPTQFTYEGLIDEIFGINNGYVQLKPEMIPTKEGQTLNVSRSGTVSRALNSNDLLYYEIRNINFEMMGPVLRKHAIVADEFHKKIEDYKSGNKSVTDIKEYVKRFKTYISNIDEGLELHIKVAEHIQGFTGHDEFNKRIEAEQRMIMGNRSALNYIEDCIAQDHHILKVLRLLVIHCHALDGIKGKLYDAIIKDFLQTYGYEHLPTIRNLERLGFLRRSETVRTNFMKLRQSLNLVTDVDPQKPDDVSYVYSGFAPISIRLVEMMAKSDFNPQNAILSQLSGQAFHVTQPPPRSNVDGAPPPSSSFHSGGGAGGTEEGRQGDRKTVMVFFIGGVTFSEIAALRYLSQNGDIDFLIGTTKLINGDSFLRSILDNTVVETKRQFCAQSTQQILDAAATQQQ